MQLRLLTWNLFHGRAIPPAGRDLLEPFSAALAGWEWDVALLQEVPPWWVLPLARGCAAEARFVLTSRNGLLAVRRLLARRWPDAVKSNGGGSNVILVREIGIEEDRVTRLGWLPERRSMHAVRLSTGVWVGNLHTEASGAQGLAAAAALRSWAGGSPAALGGDFNVPDLELPGFRRAGGYGVDQMFVTAGKTAAVKVLERGQLSDHPPVLVSVDGFSSI
jgi:endonuclease/exonuclease/phosphatase family metal-dependent hydrolase